MKNSTNKSSSKDFGLHLHEDIKRAIEKAKQQLDNGEGIPHQKVMEEIKRRFLSR